MFRTRTYAVALGVIALSAASGSLAYTFPSVFVGGQAATVAWSEETSDSFSATIAEPTSLSREDRLAQMRKKIAAEKNIFAAVLTSELEEIIEPTNATSSVGVAVDKGENRCAVYQTSSVSWNSAGVKIEEVEGARLVYKESVQTVVSSTSIPTRNILAQLPLRSAPSTAGNCIGSDVIGISMQGALIRNNEVLAYSGFSGLVGYALDGFPIYGGARSGAADICGGVTVGGQYRYNIDLDQETIINCYSATPISL